MAAAIAFLCTPAASYITGQMLVIDGGNSVREVHYRWHPVAMIATGGPAVSSVSPSHSPHRGTVASGPARGPEHAGRVHQLEDDEAAAAGQDDAADGVAGDEPGGGQPVALVAGAPDLALGHVPEDDPAGGKTNAMTSERIASRLVLRAELTGAAGITVRAYAGG